MRITILYDFLSEPGGIERVMLCMAKALKKEGHDVNLAFSYVDFELAKKFFPGFKVIEYAPLPFKDESMQISFSFIRDTEKKLRDTDLIICNSFPSSYIAYKLKKKYGLPYILFLHQSPHFLYEIRWEWAKFTLKRKVALLAGIFLNPFFRYLDKKAAFNSNLIFANCEMIRKWIKRTYERDSVVVYPPVDESFGIQKIMRETLEKFDIRGKFMLISGRITRYGMYEDVLFSMNRIKSKDFEIIFAGKIDENYKQKLLEAAKKSGIKCKFLGPVEKPELVQLYNAAQLLISTRRGEPFSLAQAEAIKCGCPVIAWNDGSGNNEIVKDGINGYLAEAYNNDNMATMIKKALEKKWDKKKVSKSVEEFSESNQVKKVVKHSESILGMKNGQI